MGIDDSVENAQRVLLDPFKQRLQSCGYILGYILSISSKHGKIIKNCRYHPLGILCVLQVPTLLVGGASVGEGGAARLCLSC
jgi:hypothetical protein